MLSGHKLSRIAIIIILFLYLFFPSGFSTTDGWYSAASIRYCSEIFHPHHLLYNVLGLVFSRIASVAGIGVLESLKVMNAFFAFSALLVIQQILFEFKIVEKHVVLISCAAGLSFSVLRYATENETYIVPLFFALLASYNWIKFITGKGDRYALFTGLWATASVLFHQIYIFWWFSLLYGFLIEKRKRPALLYGLVSITGPVVYLGVIMIFEGGAKENTIINFLMGSFREGATLGVTFSGLELSFINLVRSFIQVHGYIYNMAMNNMLLVIPGIVSLTLVILAFLKFPGKNKVNVSQKFSTVHIIIIVLQFIFAVVSYGNAEFMVMIPVIIFMLVPFFAVNYEKFLIRILIALAVWNISYGLIPLHFKSQAKEQFLCDMALSGKNVIIIASDDQLLKSMLYYKTGDNNTKSVFKSPATLSLRGENPAILEGAIDSALRRGTEIYTDCLDEEAISRQSILEGSQNRDFYSKYETTVIKSWKQSTGTKSISRIERKL